jgi:CHASE1-domain containing sensor protein
VADRLETYVAALRGAAGLFAASDEVSWAEFEAYLTRLDVEGHYPGVQGVGYARRVPHDSLDEVTDRVRAEVAQSFQVWPDSLRAEYFPIVYLHPLDARNLAALGFDMFSEPVRREAMERTRDTGEPALSGHVVLKQEIDEREVQPGFLLYQAVYDESGPVRTVEERRQRIEGFVYSPFRADDLFEGIFGTEQPRVAFRVYDGAHEDPGALLHSSSPPGLWPQHPSFRQSLSLEVAGRAWRLEFVSLPAFATTWG